MQAKDIFVLIAAILLCEAAGIIGSLFTFSEIPGWYATLVKPSFSPPNWVFGPVWTLLYALMGISLYLIWKKGQEKIDVKLPLAIFGIQLFLNFLWSILFFGMHSPLFGLICIIFLWLSIAATILLFYKISKNAAYLLTPYILWVSFASILNASIWMLN
jgi:benzodiazapine receptor